MDSKHVNKPEHDYIRLILESREAIGCSEATMLFYRERLNRFKENVFVYWHASRHEVEHYLNSIAPNQNGLSIRHCSYRVLRTFYRWLEGQYGLPNPMADLRAPILGKPVLPALGKEQVHYLLDSAECGRDRAIIATLTESGLRLSELANIKASDIDWRARTLQDPRQGAEGGSRPVWQPYGGLSA